MSCRKQTFKSFDDLIANSEQPVLVDFYATWCGPCQMMGPVMQEVGAQLTDRLQVSPSITLLLPHAHYP